MEFFKKRAAIIDAKMEEEEYLNK